VFFTPGGCDRAAGDAGGLSVLGGRGTVFVQGSCEVKRCRQDIGMNV